MLLAGLSRNQKARGSAEVMPVDSYHHIRWSLRALSTKRLAGERGTIAMWVSKNSRRLPLRLSSKNYERCRSDLKRRKHDPSGEQAFLDSLQVA